MIDPDPPARTGPSRRGLLCGAALLAAVGGCTAPSPRARTASDDGAVASRRPGRQDGVDNPQRRYLLLTAYDLAPDARGPAAAEALRTLLGHWPSAEAAGHGPSGLTATVGVGPMLPPRLGLAAPAALRPVPPLPGDRLDPARSGGDVLVQLCADDLWSAVTAADALDRAARPLLQPRWRQQGFLPPVAHGETPRNLFGFKDGTANPDPAERERWVWLDQEPHRDGSYLVVRRIRMLTDAFAGLATAGQEAVIGRHRADGAPLGQTVEFAEPDLFAKTPDGGYVLPAHSHVRLAHPRLDAGARMLRRGYSYADAPDDQGLVFLAFMRDPTLFTRVQQRLATGDAMSAYVEHTASAVFLVLPGEAPGHPLGTTLFATAAPR